MLTTRGSVGLPPNLKSPTQNVQPTNDFVRFEKHWTAKSIPDCFKDCVRAGDADRVALGLLDRDLSYRELDQLSDGVAHALISLRGPRPEPIPLLLEHDAPVPAAMLGVLKAGKFYVPLDPSYPLDRNRYVLNDSQAELLVTNTKHISLAASLCRNDCPVVNLDEIPSRVSGDYSRVTGTADDLVQVLYTSGSTGKPKGVMHTHHSLLYNVMRHTNGRHICRDDRIALLFSYSFGPAIVNLFSALLNAAAAFPFNVKELGVIRLAQWLIDREITQLHTVPTLFRHLVENLAGGQTFPRLRLIQLGGETMFSSDLDRFKKHFSDTCLLSVGMGSAECGHVFDCGYNKETECATDILPVGYPVEDTEALLLDAESQPVGFGCIGEIAIKGSFLSPGYWRQPELTQTVFLPGPAGGSDRIYLTGDLGCMLPDGCVFHLGRKDARVKIKGYRIEIPEVEAALLNISSVKEAVVIAQDGPAGDKRLVAYVVTVADGAPSVRMFWEALRGKLPDYMVPSAFVILESLPLLPNGKVDRRALPAPGRTRPQLDNPLVPPRTPVEAAVCTIWRQVLDLDEVGVDDAFLDLGGTSLAAGRIMTRIAETFPVDLPLRLLFETPTVAGLAATIAARVACGRDRVDQERLLAELERLSEAEAERLLADVRTEPREKPHE
jgi:amino acid adenylation domain-containing protein